MLEWNCPASAASFTRALPVRNTSAMNASHFSDSVHTAKFLNDLGCRFHDANV